MTNRVSKSLLTGMLAGLCAVLLLPGCRAARYQVQRRYSYPPSREFYERASATNVSPGAVQRPEVKAAPVTSAAKPAARPSAPASAPASARTQPAQPTAVAAPAPAPRVVLGVDDSSAVAYRLKAGDPVVVYLRGIPGTPGGEQMIENIVSEHGTIQLPFLDSVYVGGKTTTEAQDLIRAAYLDGEIYKYLTVNVLLPTKSFFIQGEVRMPGRYPLVGNVTLLQAIAAAGGYTEFANRGNVEISRGEKRIPVNVKTIERYPDRDIVVEPGDVIVVKRSFF